MKGQASSHGPYVAVQRYSLMNFYPNNRLNYVCDKCCEWNFEGESVILTYQGTVPKVSGVSSLKKRHLSWNFFILLEKTTLPHFALHQASDHPMGYLHQVYPTMQTV